MDNGDEQAIDKRQIQMDSKRREVLILLRGHKNANYSYKGKSLYIPTVKKC